MGGTLELALQPRRKFVQKALTKGAKFNGISVIHYHSTISHCVAVCGGEVNNWVLLGVLFDNSIKYSARHVCSCRYCVTCVSGFVIISVN